MSETSPTKSGFTSPDRATMEDYLRCVHCGLCLNHCPTYRLWGLEADSPRGRIRQMLLVEEGKMSLGDTFVKHIDLCLDCRACETACPSGVEYGKLVESARAEINLHYQRPLVSSTLRNLAYRHLLPYPGRIAALARILRIYQGSWMQRLARGSGILRLLGMEQAERIQPTVEREFFFSRLGRTFPASGPKRARVAFFAGCLAQVTFARLNDATIRVLTANGCEVVVPEGQLCCGALPAHAGVRDVAQNLARTNMDVFLRENFDAIITNAAGCGSTLKEYDDLLAEDADYAEKAKRFTGKVKDVSEYLVELGLRPPARKLEARVTYQDPCHLAHGQKIRSAPRDLLRAASAELVEMPHSDHCCGSAGIYNVVENQLSMQILDAKMEDVASVPAEVIATANVGCMLQLRAGVARRGLKREVKHVIELLAACY
ncbi:MAG: 4Fe-4S dicluster domain-containing protein [Acidobacteria bacterium]|nr:4Fe-4S dicluster domain-containing protein [Acidobacteriota bacterium]